MSVVLSSMPTAQRNYTVRLYFLEPDEKHPGERVFDVLLQDKPVLKALDVAKETSGSNRAMVREFKGIEATTNLKIDLNTITGRTLLSGVEIVVED